MAIASGILTYATTPIVGTTWDPAKAGTSMALSGGNLVATVSSLVATSTVLSVVGKSTSKWYWEITVTTTNNQCVVGVGKSTVGLNTPNFLGIDSGGYGYYNGLAAPGTKVNGGGFTAYGSTYTTADVISIALDMDNLFLYFALNGVWQNAGDPTSGATGTGAAFSNAQGIGGTLFAGFGPGVGPEAVTANFGSTAFSFTVPTGYNAGLF